jgi:hypothetical protein
LEDEQGGVVVGAEAAVVVGGAAGVGGEGVDDRVEGGVGVGGRDGGQEAGEPGDQGERNDGPYERLIPQAAL